MATIILILVALGTGIFIGFSIGFSRAIREAIKDMQKKKSPNPGWLFAGIGSIFLVVALVTSLYTWHFTRIAKRTNGTVIELLKEVDRNSGSAGYAPTFQFQDANGTPHTVSSSLYSSPPEFHVGDAVKVLYRSDDPQSARIDSYWQLWGLPCIFGILGGIGLPVGIILLLWPKIIVRLRGRRAITPGMS